MPPDQRRPINGDILAALMGILNEFRAAVDEVTTLTLKVKELSTESAKAEKGAADRAQAMGRHPPEPVPERERLIETYNRRTVVFERCRELWDRARKPIITVAMRSDQDENVLAAFRLLPEHPNADEFRRCVEFLEIILEAVLPDATVDQDQNVKPGEVKRPRGRPAEIAEGRKAAALELKTNGGTNLAAAKILYGVHQPSKRQRDNVYAILATYRRKHAIDVPRD